MQRLGPDLVVAGSIFVVNSGQEFCKIFWKQNEKEQPILPQTDSSHLKMDGWKTSFLSE